MERPPSLNQFERNEMIGNEAFGMISKAVMRDLNRSDTQDVFNSQGSGEYIQKEDLIKCTEFILYPDPITKLRKF